MNERLSRIGNQVKQAFGKVRDVWMNQEAVRRRRVLIIGIGIIVFAIVLVIVLNAVKGRYVVLYDGMGQEESIRANAVLTTAGISSRINASGQLEVASKDASTAMGQLALQGIPSVTLDYNIFAQASGLTSTESERREYLKFQWMNRLQDIIKTYNGVQNAYVNLNMPDSNGRVWDPNASKGSGAVQITMKPGYVLNGEQAYAIRYMVGSSVGIDPDEVVVTDSEGRLLAAAGGSYDIAAAATGTFLERMDLASAVEQSLMRKAAEAIHPLYSDPEQWENVSIVASVQMNFDRVVQELKEYFPLEGTNHGVVDSQERDFVMGPNDLASGVVGETDNTDVPIYVDLNGDGEPDLIDYHEFIDYAVSYSLQQIEKDGPSVEKTSISLAIPDASLSFEKQQQLVDLVKNATLIDPENITVMGFALVPGGTGETGTGGLVIGGFAIPELYLFIAVAAIVVLIIVLVLVMTLRRKAKKKRELAEIAAEQAEQEEAERIANEIEERKRQLKDAAMGEPGEDAIINEVREFARANPEITAGLLRNWLKDEAG